MPIERRYHSLSWAGLQFAKFRTLQKVAILTVNLVLQFIKYLQIRIRRNPPPGVAFQTVHLHLLIDFWLVEVDVAGCIDGFSKVFGGLAREQNALAFFGKFIVGLD